MVRPFRFPGPQALAALATAHPLASLFVCQFPLALCGVLKAGRVAFAACFLAAFAGLAFFTRRWPQREGGRGMAGVLALGLVLRLVFVWAWPADSDVARYIVEGALQQAGGNPYALAPADPRTAALLPKAARQALAGVNHKDLAAAYPPLAELYCRLTAAVSPTPLAFKAAAALADLCGCAVLALVLARSGRPAALLLLAAANPLSLAMGAGEGHLDAVMIPLVALALAAFDSHRAGFGFAGLGAAGLVKYPALLLAPFFLNRGNAAKAGWTLAPFAAFALFAGAGTDLFASLAVFARYSAQGGPLVALLRPVFGQGAPLAAMAVGAGVLGLLWLTVQDARRGPPAALAVTLACLPTVYPWYFLPLVPLWAVRPSWSLGWLLAAQGLAAAPTWLRPGELGGEGIVLAWVWLPWLGLALAGAWRPLLLVREKGFAPVGGLAVVTPARNEAARLGACLESLAAPLTAGEVAEVVVVDGGSDDDTASVARAHGARVVAAAGGRGGQIAAGIAACRSGVVLVLHADCRLAPGAAGRILRALAREPRLAGGAVGMRFDRGEPGLALIAGLNSLRAGTVGIAFGDQGQFFRREALEGSGGFPDMALMEDVELSLRLREAGETKLLGGGVLVSARRWEGQGFWPRTLGVLRLCAAYLAGRRLGLADVTGRKYFRRYYGREPTTRT
ncbi:glycosyltransferase [Solidesulfovibrio sp.]|uniref:glycosyltransferase n=1 Tax=Solidesulfovibrio sp. TaxID=2910990 RepID=UPI00262E55FD|nr:glycosyltransferase [Solidesulfovibrio sp.]